MNTDTNERLVDSRDLVQLSSLEELKFHVYHAVNTDHAFFIMGPPGIGKSACINSLDPNEYVIHVEDLCTVDVPDIAGILVPNMQDKTSFFTKPKIITVCEKLTKENPGKILVLFLDDITNADTSILASLYRLILDRKIGDYSLPENVRIICAGNDATNSQVANDIPLPLANRGKTVLYRGPTIEEFCNYAVDNNMRPEVISLLRKYPEYLNGDGANVSDRLDRLAVNTPRSWENCSIAMDSYYASGVNKRSWLTNLIASYIGVTLSSKIDYMIDNMEHVCSYESIIKSPDNPPKIKKIEDSILFLQTEIITSGLKSDMYKNDFFNSDKSIIHDEILPVKRNFEKCLKFLKHNSVQPEYTKFLLSDVERLAGQYWPKVQIRSSGTISNIAKQSPIFEKIIGGL